MPVYLYVIVRMEGTGGEETRLFDLNCLSLTFDPQHK